MPTVPTRRRIFTAVRPRRVAVGVETTGETAAVPQGPDPDSLAE